jgi:hypothetical protein
MGSTETDSMDELHKLYQEDDAKFYSVCANRVEMASELVPMFIANIKALPKRTHGGITEGLNIAVHGHRTQHFKWDIMAQRYSFLHPSPQGMIPLTPNSEPKILEDWQAFDVGAEMIVGTFDETGQALLYSIGPQYDKNGAVQGLVHLHEFPGHWSIGTGAYNANFWLNYRQHTLGRSIRQSAYHAYEAKIMASKSPTVNDNIEIVVATLEKSWLLTKETPEREGCEVSLLELEKMFNKYGPQNTHDLGYKTNPVTSRKSAGQA